MNEIDIEAVIFDLDGVLTDTSEHHFLAWKRLADEEGIRFTREDNEQLRGVSRRRSLELLLKGRPVTDEQALEMMERKNRYYQQLIQRVTPDNLVPGVTSLLKALRAKHIKIAIASASKNARTVIARLGISDMVDAIADGYSVQRTKPAPDLFLYAADQLKVAPERCAVVEDAAAGVEAALAAGMRAIGLGPVARFSDADAIFPDLAGLTWNDIQRELAHHRDRVST